MARLSGAAEFIDLDRDPGSDVGTDPLKAPATFMDKLTRLLAGYVIVSFVFASSKAFKVQVFTNGSKG